MILHLGEVVFRKFVDDLKDHVRETCIIWNVYGPAEVTTVSTYKRIRHTYSDVSVPVGRPLPNYVCMIMDEFLQLSFVGQEGELFIGGVGVFVGYLGRADLTAKALIEINGEIFYRTGDVVRMDKNGLIYHQGRKDHQIKLHGQRIELGEIERCLLDTSISACAVKKWGDHHLIAYVQSSNIDEKQLREHCESHLPPHMVPSLFIILEKLPLNANGKIDRKLLPSPNFSTLLPIHLRNDVQSLAPRNEIEVIIHHIWCEIFQQNQIPIDVNIFTIGGHSLLLMQLFHRYKIQFHLETNTLSIANVFQQPTIIGHAQLIHQINGSTQHIGGYSWSSLHLIQGKNNFFNYFQLSYVFRL